MSPRRIHDAPTDATRECSVPQDRMLHFGRRKANWTQATRQASRTTHCPGCTTLSNVGQTDGASPTALSVWAGINPAEFTLAQRDDPEPVVMSPSCRMQNRISVTPRPMRSRQLPRPHTLPEESSTDDPVLMLASGPSEHHNQNLQWEANVTRCLTPSGCSGSEAQHSSRRPVFPALDPSIIATDYGRVYWLHR